MLSSLYQFLVCLFKIFCFLKECNCLLLHFGIGHQLLLAELGKVDDSTEIAPQSDCVWLAYILQSTHKLDCISPLVSGDYALLFKRRSLVQTCSTAEGNGHELQRLCCDNVHTS